MDIQKDCADLHVVRRLEVVSGPTGRRRWPSDVKARIVAESFEPWTSVSEVARRHGLRPSHLFMWRRQARLGQLVTPSVSAGFAPVLVAKEGEDERPMSASTEERIEVEVCGVILRLPLATPAQRLAEIVQVLRGTS